VTLLGLVRTIDVALMNLRAHVFRAFLAALGVVLGVGAVVGMTAISEGAKREALDQIMAEGIDNIVVTSVPPAEEGAANDAKQGAMTDEYGVTERDIEHLAAAFENIRELVPVRDMRRKIYAGGRLTGVHMVATTPRFLDITGCRIVDPRGRWLTDQDRQRRAPVCVLGESAARKLFAYRDPLRETISVAGAMFEVVGIVRNPRGARLAGNYDLNELVYIPFETGQAIYGSILLNVVSRMQMQRTKVYADYLYVRVQDVAQLPNTAARLRTYLKSIHEGIDYEIKVPYELLLRAKETQRIFTVVMGSIAAISLLVGGIGIMNIMLANIYERTREIGTRRALGAKRSDILLQFMIESVLLTGLGGGVGLAAGIGIARMVELYATMRTEVTPLSIVLALAVSILTGVVFGTYPAWKAASLDPIVALRHE